MPKGQRKRTNYATSQNAGLVTAGQNAGMGVFGTQQGQAQNATRTSAAIINDPIINQHYHGIGQRVVQLLWAGMATGLPLKSYTGARRGPKPKNQRQGQNLSTNL